MQEEEQKGPIEVIRDGAIKASIWKNKGEKGTFLTVSFARTFSKDGEPQDGHSFTGRDMLVLAEVARQAYCFVSNYRAVQNEIKHDL